MPGIQAFFFNKKERNKKEKKKKRNGFPRDLELTTHFSVVVPKNVRVAHGTSLYDAGEIDGTACLNEQLLVAQNCRVWL